MALSDQNMMKQRKRKDKYTLRTKWGQWAPSLWPRSEGAPRQRCHVHKVYCENSLSNNDLFSKQGSNRLAQNGSYDMYIDDKLWHELNNNFQFLKTCGKDFCLKKKLRLILHSCFKHANLQSMANFYVSSYKLVTAQNTLLDTWGLWLSQVNLCLASKFVLRG